MVTMSLVIVRLVVAAAGLELGINPLPVPEPAQAEPAQTDQARVNPAQAEQAPPPTVGDAQPAVKPETKPAERAGAPTDITNADELLTALQTVGEDIHRLSAKVRYIKTFAIQGDTQRRDGTLMFVSEPGPDGQAPTRRFAITFDRYEIGGRLEDPSTGFLEKYIFDGQWLAEVHPLDKEFVRRQIVPPGEQWDPLRLGEGPFPIPIQQDRAEILSRFDAKLLDGLDGVDEPALRGIAGKCYQLLLTPRADAGQQDLRFIRVWYEKDNLLPRMAKTMSTADDESFVLLGDIKLNGDAQVDEAEISTEPPADRTGWDITQELYQE